MKCDKNKNDDDDDPSSKNFPCDPSLRVSSPHDMHLLLPDFVRLKHSRIF